MPALTTHHLFGEESVERLPQGIVASGNERTAFILGNQGPDPFFFRVRTPNMRTCMKLAQVMHRSRMTRQMEALREGVQRLPQEDAGVGRAFALGLLSHYVLDRNAHPFVYAQQWGIQETDPSLKDSGSQVHAVIESDLDVLMLQLKRYGATTAECPPADELATNERVDRVAGALFSNIATTVYGLDVGISEYGGAVADMKLVYTLIEPAGSMRARTFEGIERAFVSDYSMLRSLAHRVTTEVPAGTGNLRHLRWKDPFTEQESSESFPEVFDRALDDYEQAAALFIDGDMPALTGHVNYSGRVLTPDEEFDREE